MGHQVIPDSDSYPVPNSQVLDAANCLASAVDNSPGGQGSVCKRLLASNLIKCFDGTLCKFTLHKYMVMIITGKHVCTNAMLCKLT